MTERFSIKEKLFAHLETMRPYTVIWCGLVSLVGACITLGDFPPLKISVLALFIPIMGWIAGLYLSDYLDKELDAIQKPHRPLPSGRIKPKEELMIGAIYAIGGLLLSFLLNIKNIILIFVVASLVFSYAKFAKSHGFIGNLNRGLVTVAAYFFGVFSIDKAIDALPLYIWLLPLVFLFHDTNSNLIGAIRDVDGDNKGGYLTIPVKYGVKKSVYLSLTLTLIWLSVALVLQFFYKFLKIEFYLVMILDILILISLYIYLSKSIATYSRKKGLKFHEFFVIERITLASAFIFGIVSLHIAFTIFLLALIVTIVTQYTLRKKYEFQGIEL